VNTLDIRVRKVQGEVDYWKVRGFLREVFLRNDRKEYSWQTARLDYWRWHGMGNCHPELAWTDLLFLFEDENHELLGVLCAEEPGQNFLQLPPSLPCPELETRMIQTAEQNMTLQTKEGSHKLWIFSHATNEGRNALLQARGYSRCKWKENQYYRELQTLPPKPPLPEGFRLRSMRTEGDLEQRSWASWRAFHSDEPDENYDNDQGAWYHKITIQPMYRRDLDVVVEPLGGPIVGFCTVWFDDVTRTGYFEPVGLMPEFQRKGLGKALLYEGMKRLKAIGGTLATVGGSSEGANRLYASMMGPPLTEQIAWLKELP